MSRDELIRDLARELRDPRYDLRGYGKTINQIREDFIENGVDMPWSRRGDCCVALREMIGAMIELYKELIVDAIRRVDKLETRIDEIDEAE